ncbi:restriction endonuclease [Micromonospora sp. 4G57]|uniref:Restriction endonuclease n=1 Tax=Micromonospora sicca TaxID=2202420 RepID=A0ABU5JNV8_9ACTN|nr:MULTISPECIES: restriction endonuclease [unclassified Micromonospora]MDZ5447593.1 restriction endonuclease [Micromonospora sp. 4G57]MDZ5494333.1 restriction endonuclease [Micromonospora sp. 4G53]
MALIQVREAGPAVQVHLSAEDARRLAASEIVEVRPGPTGGMWIVRAGNKVGAARIGEVELHIEPKVPVARLLFLVGYARNPKGWRNENVALTDEKGLVPALAAALWRQTDRALRPGLLQGYQVIDETSPILRGRLRETAQLSRRAGLALPLEIRHDEYTVDIPENRILATAVDRMLAVPGIGAESRRMLRHLAGRFVGVVRLRAGLPAPMWRPSRLNDRLVVALRLAELVLAGASVEAGRGGVVSNAFLLDMWRVYEDFLSVALREAIEPVDGGTVSFQAHQHLDEARQLDLRPDILWRDASGGVGAVVDAKYKADAARGDAYQMLAYCIAYQLSRGHLVYVSGDHPPVRHLVRNAGIEIVCHALDLEAAPVDLLAQVRVLSETIIDSKAASTVALR